MNCHKIGTHLRKLCEILANINFSSTKKIFHKMLQRKIFAKSYIFANSYYIYEIKN